MLNNVEIVYQQAIDASHHGRPTVVERVHTGRPGRPRVVIDPNFLQFAHEHRSTTGIRHFLNVSRGVVQAALLRQGLIEPGMAPFEGPPFEDPLSENAELPEAPLGLEDDILDPDYAVPQVLPADVADAAPPLPPSNGDLSTNADWELDSLLLRLRTHFRRVGISMLDGMLRRLGHRVQWDRIRESLCCIDPVHRVFQRIRIRRRSIHDVGATWSENFTMLELHHGLDINNVNHIWLLHHLFLPTINDQPTFFAQSWNKHRIQIRNGPNRSPVDMFYFDTLVHGARGHALVDDISEEELEVYGVDWEGLHDDTLLHSQRENNAAEMGRTSWLRRVGPPEHLNEVPVESPEGPLHLDQVAALEAVIGQWRGLAANSDIIHLWSIALAFCCTLNNTAF
ncbi:hypothetical protein B0H16DRAFT_1664698 [Mycena metata]|uniref:Integrase core domain-containing protein n=1 Tax=Mycena metata TaxID=1033252 RepID=A0AAD7MZU6_9AGAR|nr:hypothetical protein B0H16DRAFT_1664698 [Mycena metata]